VPKSAYFAPDREGNLLTGRVPINQTLAYACHLSKQHHRTRFKTLPVLIDCCLRLLSPLSHGPPLGIANVLSVSAALRESARDKVEVFEGSDDLWWRHDATVAAVWLRVRHQDALDRSARGAIAEPVFDEVMQPTEEWLER
jgi:hypothetical protein